MTNRDMFKQAHAVAKLTVAYVMDYGIAFSLALRDIHRQARVRKMRRKLSVRTNAGGTTVTSEYNSLFVSGARALAGSWDGERWNFDARNEQAVRALCTQVYGGVSPDDADVVDIEIMIPEDSRKVSERRQPIELFGWTLARAFGRDSGAKLGEGVVVKKGGFSSGGSRANWYTETQNGTTVILRDVSRELVNAHDNDAFIVTIINK